MAGTYLTTCRHGTTLYFRRRVPDDLRPAIGRPYLVRSLGTSRRRDAIILARLLAAKTDQLFSNLRQMPRKKNHRVDLKIVMDFSDSGLLKSLSVETEHPDEIPAAQEIARSALSGADAAASPEIKPANKAATKSLTETWEDYKSEKIATGTWKDGEDTARYDHLPHVRALIDAIGDKAIGTVTAEDVVAFQTRVLKDPAGGTANNRKKRLTRAGALLRWAKKKRIIPDAFDDLFQFPGKIEQNSYVAFDQNDLKALFESPDYREHRFRTPSEYWLPLLGLHTGARLNELCQLTRADISEHDGIPTITVLDDDDKRLKTTASRRIIPIHTNLIRCGLLEYVATVGTGRLFPELPESAARRGDYTKEASRKFTDYRRKQGVGTTTGKSNKTFHSFRSTLISALRKAGVPGDRRRRLAGHEAIDVHDKNYSGGDELTMFDFKTLKNDIELVRYDVTFTPYEASASTTSLLKVTPT